MQFVFQIYFQDSAFSNSKVQSYIADVIAVSPSVDLAGPLPLFPQLDPWDSKGIAFENSCHVQSTGGTL